MQLVFVFAIGLLFGIGLIVSGMTDPGKVLGFLDLAGNWDPSLLFVMGGATLVAAIGFALARRRGRTLSGAPIRLPTSTAIDRRLVIGSLVFGAGWGLAGFCPGPALASLGTGRGEPLLFVLAMVAGMALFELAEWLRARGPKMA
ncbi:YeeE/YedE family protein [Massilia litorea]|uniref:YeeE/YedE family protein n=1 Tax=Massilia litorea TaxID=2769491 RepID=A0A7L9U0Y9_9BURK|nr:YeeE/YedE family protein [Massilia litorea]QOL48711.1 YeeE/YedE family protein [Massilia litorea]